MGLLGIYRYITMPFVFVSLHIQAPVLQLPFPVFPVLPERSPVRNNNEDVDFSRTGHCPWCWPIIGLGSNVDI